MFSNKEIFILSVGESLIMNRLYDAMQDIPALLVHNLNENDHIQLKVDVTPADGIYEWRVIFTKDHNTQIFTYKGDRLIDAITKFKDILISETRDLVRDNKNINL